MNTARQHAQRRGCPRVRLLQGLKWRSGGLPQAELEVYTIGQLAGALAGCDLISKVVGGQVVALLPPSTGNTTVPHRSPKLPNVTSVKTRPHRRSKAQDDKGWPALSGPVVESSARKNGGVDEVHYAASSIISGCIQQSTPASEKTSTDSC